jgi:hypothetical protein
MFFYHGNNHIPRMSHACFHIKLGRTCDGFSKVVKKDQGQRNSRKNNHEYSDRG